MENIHKKIGIIGGGQLGKMMILEAKKMGFYITVLDPTLNCPAHTLVDEHIVANFNDSKAIKLIASKSDIITYEFEHIGADTLEILEKEGKKIYPTAKSLKIIQNKLLQKNLLLKNNAPVPEFIEVKNIDDIKNAGEIFGYPFVLKACTGGYDGKGNFIINKEEEITKGYEFLGNGKIQLMAEKFFQKQLKMQ